MATVRHIGFLDINQSVNQFPTQLKIQKLPVPSGQPIKSLSAFELHVQAKQVTAAGGAQVPQKLGANPTVVAPIMR